MLKEEGRYQRSIVLYVGLQKTSPRVISMEPPRC